MADTELVVVLMAGKTVIISNQPFFYKKADLFPGSAFVVGADTVVRLLNVRSHDSSSKLS